MSWKGFMIDNQRGSFAANPFTRWCYQRDFKRKSFDQFIYRCDDIQSQKKSLTSRLNWYLQQKSYQIKVPGKHEMKSVTFYKTKIETVLKFYSFHNSLQNNVNFAGGSIKNFFFDFRLYMVNASGSNRSEMDQNRIKGLIQISFRVMHIIPNQPFRKPSSLLVLV